MKMYSWITFVLQCPGYLIKLILNFLIYLNFKCDQLNTWFTQFLLKILEKCINEHFT